MPKISKKASVMLSIVLASAFIAIIAALAVVMPFALSDSSPTRDFIDVLASERLGAENVVAVFLVWGYCVLADALACCVAVLFLLIRVRNGLVFTEISVSIIRFVSWCCLILAAIILFAQVLHLPLRFWESASELLKTLSRRQPR